MRSNKVRIDYLSNHPDKIKQVAQWLFDEWGYLRNNCSLEKRYVELVNEVNDNIIPIHLVAIIDENLWVLLHLNPLK